jgi:hypothetical protein
MANELRDLLLYSILQMQIMFEIDTVLLNLWHVLSPLRTVT